MATYRATTSGNHVTFLLNFFDDRNSHEIIK